MYDCIVNETYRKRSIMADKITIVTTKGNRADVPVTSYTDDSNLDLTTLASIIDSAAAYAVKDLDGGAKPGSRSVWDALTDAIQNPDGPEPDGDTADEQTDHAVTACHAATARHCGDNQHVHMPKITMNEIPTVTMNEIAGESEGDGDGDSLKAASGRSVAPSQLHDYVKKAVAWHRSRHYYDRPHDYYTGPVLTFDYVDSLGKRSVKSVVLSLADTDPADDWFGTYTDGQYRNFRYDRIKGDHVEIKDDPLGTR